jgi:hypothetical protein
MGVIITKNGGYKNYPKPLFDIDNNSLSDKELA